MESKMFNSEEDEKLIELVKNNPMLYDCAEKNYRCKDLRENLWIEIAASLGKSVTECKTRWRTIRDSYRKNMKRMQTVPYKAYFTKSKYKVGKLDFLDAIFYRKQIEMQQHGYQNDIAESDINDEINIYPEAQTYLSTTENDRIQSEDQYYFDNFAPNRRETLIYNCDSQNQENYNIVELGVKQENKEYFQLESEFGRASSKNVMNFNTPSNENNENHPIELFFKSMAKTVMNFPPHLIPQVRMQVCEIVSEMEMRVIQENQMQDQLDRF